MGDSDRGPEGTGRESTRERYLERASLERKRGGGMRKVQKSIQAKRVAKEELDRDNTEENRAKYKEKKKMAKRW